MAVYGAGVRGAGRERDRDRGEQNVNMVPGHPWPVLVPPPHKPPVGPAERQDVGHDLKSRLVFLMMGSANMEGRAQMPPGDPGHDRLYALNEQGKWRSAAEPVHPYANGSGPGMWFGRRLIELLPDSAGVFLVPCAWGTSKSDDWVQGAPLFNAAVQRGRLGTEACDGELAGVLWHLGEIDALNENDAKKIGGKLGQMFKDFREAVGVNDLPFLMGRLGEHLKKPPKNETYRHAWLINEAIEAMSRDGGSVHNLGASKAQRAQMRFWMDFVDSVPRVRQVAADKCTVGHDGIHFDMYGQQMLGARYADAWWAMEGHAFQISLKQKTGGLVWGPKPEDAQEVGRTQGGEKKMSEVKRKYELEKMKERAHELARQANFGKPVGSIGANAKIEQKATEVLACDSFDDARTKFPDVIRFALKDGPSEAVFKAHWAPAAEYHSSLVNVIRKSAENAAAAAAVPAGGTTADTVLSCKTFEEAKERHPAVVQIALREGPAEGVFRAHWLPTAEYHASLRGVITRAAAAAAKQPAPAADSSPFGSFAFDPLKACAGGFDPLKACAGGAPAPAATPPDKDPRRTDKLKPLNFGWLKK